MKKIFVILSFCLPIQLLLGQTSRVKIGDTIPDLQMEKIINYSLRKAKVSDFKGKLLILDFWATWCSPCISFFRKADSLQKEFEEDLMIVPITYEAEEDVSKFLERYKLYSGILPLSIVEDTLFHNAFPREVIPHEIWINPQGKVIAITSSEEVNSMNISAILKGENLSLEEKVDFSLKTNITNSVFDLVIPIKNVNKTNLQVPDHRIITKSIITSYIPGLQSYISDRNNKESNRFTAGNMGIHSICKWVLGKLSEARSPDVPENKFYLYSDARIKYELLNDSVIYNLNQTPRDYNNKQWIPQNAITMEMIVPKIYNVREKYEKIYEELNAYIGSVYNVQFLLEKRSVKCLVLKRTSTVDKLASKSVGESTWKDDRFSFKCNKTSFRLFTSRLISYHLQGFDLPVLDNTGYVGQVDIELNCKLSDVSSLNKELKKYDLEFFTEERVVEVIVVKPLSISIN